jgi:signal transduction histidine kinase
VFQIAQEALRNALRHAGAGEVTVCIEQSDGGVELEIHDDGCGFVVPARLHSFAGIGHFGLVGIAERVEQAGGVLTVASAPGAGTTIGARLPMAGPRDRDD